MLKLGYGLPSAILGEFSYGQSKKALSYAFAVRHNSANNANIQLQKFRTNALDVSIGNQFNNDILFKADAFLNIDYYNLFAVDFPIDTAVSPDLALRRLMHGKTNLKLRKNGITPSLDGEFRLGYNFIHNNKEMVRDQILNLDGKLELSLSNDFNLDIPLSAGFAFSNLDSTITRFSIQPLFKFNRSFFSLELGGNLGFTDDFFIYPKALLNINKIAGYFDVFAGVSQDLFFNTGYNKGLENPFMHFSTSKLTHSSFQNYFVGLRANIEGAKLEFTTDYRVLENMHMFVPSTQIPQQFEVLYDDGTDLQLKAMLTYEITHNITLTGTMEKHFYNMEMQDKAWHHPDLEADFTSRFTFLENRLRLNASLFFASGLKYPDAVGQSVNLPVIFDLSGEIQYQLYKSISVFAKWNNITATKYNRWYQYPSYRIYLLGGIKASF